MRMKSLGNDEIQGIVLLKQMNQKDTLLDVQCHIKGQQSLQIVCKRKAAKFQNYEDDGIGFFSAYPSVQNVAVTQIFVAKRKKSRSEDV